MLQILSKILAPNRRPVRALVLTPTRELADQVFTNVKHYSKFLDLRTAVIFGGVNQNPQIKQLRNGVDVLVATETCQERVDSMTFISIFRSH